MPWWTLALQTPFLLLGSELLLDYRKEFALDIPCDKWLGSYGFTPRAKLRSRFRARCAARHPTLHNICFSAASTWMHFALLPVRYLHMLTHPRSGVSSSSKRQWTSISSCSP